MSVFEKYVLLDNDNIQHVPYLKEKVPIVEWSNWKYLIYAEGYSAARAGDFRVFVFLVQAVLNL